MMTSWKELISIEMDLNEETWNDVVACTISSSELTRLFRADSYRIEGSIFTLWTKCRVYFPCSEDGREYVSSVSRNFDGKHTYHIGD